MATNVTEKDKALQEVIDYVQSYNDLSYRRRPASEILWAMVKANGKRTN